METWHHSAKPRGFLWKRKAEEAPKANGQSHQSRRKTSTVKSKKKVNPWFSTWLEDDYKPIKEAQLIFPKIVHTALRSDIVIWSWKKKIITTELIVRWETWSEEAHERRAAKCANLVEELRGNGWQTWQFLLRLVLDGSQHSHCGSFSLHWAWEETTDRKQSLVSAAL